MKILNRDEGVFYITDNGIESNYKLVGEYPISERYRIFKNFKKYSPSITKIEFTEQFDIMLT